LGRFEKIDTAKKVIKQTLTLNSIPEHRQRKKERKEKKNKALNASTDSELTSSAATLPATHHSADEITEGKKTLCCPFHSPWSLTNLLQMKLKRRMF